MRITEVMTKDVRTVAPTMSAVDAWAMMKFEGIHHLVVMRASRMVGVLSDRDISPQRRTPKMPKSVTVEDLMSVPVVTVEEGETIRKASHVLKGRTVGCLPVTNNGKLVGIVTMADLLEALARGGSGDRPAKLPRATLSHRTPHKKQHLATGMW